LKGYRLWAMGKLDSNVQSRTVSQQRRRLLQLPRPRLDVAVHKL
jgi:hypothetical protein